MSLADILLPSVVSTVFAVVVIALVVAARRRPAAGAHAADYRHTYRLVALLAVGLGGALGARALAKPANFPSEAYYRAAAATVAEAPVRHVGQAACAECHDDETKLHDKDAHAAVPCEDCHGPGADHVAKAGEGGILKPSGKEACLVCHLHLDARPPAFPQIEWRAHYKFVGVKDDKIDCTTCHSPHEPLFMDRDLRQARLHPLVHRCQDCHQGRMDETTARPAGHQPIFECSYCHAKITEDFKSKPHAGKVQCTTCHIFIKQSDYAGRIIRDTDARFCLLCHRQAPYRSETAAPGISWPQHAQEGGAEGDPKTWRCVDCHLDRLHSGLEVKKHGQ